MKKNIAVAIPFPSGSNLHVGHAYAYTIVDSYCKLQRYLGYEVLQPFAYDSHGLPTENYALKIGKPASIVADENISNFREEMKRMNTSYQEMFCTHSPEYIKRTQWLFTELYNHGLAYKKKGFVNYDPIDKTVLANEQVINGIAERSGAKVEIIEMEQWYLNITKYAERLLNFDNVDYPKHIIKQQIEWIGKSDGYEIDFGDDIKVFTTKPETILDVKFIVISSENGKEEFTGNYLINPVSKEEIPIWTSVYVIKGYGTGYVMGVPNDDKRDRDFAIRNKIDFDSEKHIIDDLSDLHFCLTKKTNYKLRDWCVSRQRKFGCPIPLPGETDTLDTFVDSSFYTIEYDKEKPMDLYVCGAEHSCSHLLYARFITKFLFDIGYINFEEPFLKLICQGMITKDGKKMSKSKGNTINLNEYEPQALRMYLMFINHYFEGGEWQDNGYIGCVRFINRMKLWLSESSETENIDLETFKKTVIAYFESWKTNKVVSEWMTFYNKHKNVKLNIKQLEELKEFFNICF